MKDKRILHFRMLLFYAVSNFFTSIFSFIWLYSIPSDKKGVVFLNLSLERISLLGFVIFTALLFGCLALFTWTRPGFSQWIQNNILDTPKSTWLFLASFVFIIGTWFSILLPTPSLVRASALYLRILPVLVLAGLIFVETALLIFYLSPPTRIFCAKLLEKIRIVMSSSISGWVLLGFSLLVGLIQIYYSFYNLGDEGDTLTIGWIISRGNILYKDVFSHHFPFAYYWTAFVIKLFGNSILAVRLSLLVLRTVCFGITMKLSRYHFGFGLTALAWSCIGYLYLGNMLQFYSFSSIFIVCCFGLIYSIINGYQVTNIKVLIVSGLYLGLAILTDPLTIFPAAVIIMAVFISGVIQPTNKRSIKRGLVQVGTLLLPIIGCGSIFLIYLLLTNSMQAFIRDAILFNTQIYDKYAGALRLSQLFLPAATGIGIFDAHWVRFTDPYFSLMYYDLNDQWIFSGFFYRFAIILSSIILLFRRNFISGIYIYLLGATLLFRASEFFQSAPFVLLSLCVVSIGVSTSLTRHQKFETNKIKVRSLKIWSKIRNVFSTIGLFMLGLMFIWLNIRGIVNLNSRRESLTYQANFSGLEGTANYYKKMTCHIADARILVYPLNSYIYFMSSILPASRYSFMTPWVAEIGLDETIKALNQEQFLLISINKNSDIWGFPNKVYLGKLIDFLDINYKEFSDGFYQSTQLNQICHPN